MEQMENACRFLVGNAEGMRTLRDLEVNNGMKVTGVSKIRLLK
jgi:hypothetical protein